jgi:hypothetical protein
VQEGGGLKVALKVFGRLCIVSFNRLAEMVVLVLVFIEIDKLTNLICGGKAHLRDPEQKHP